MSCPHCPHCDPTSAAAIGYSSRVEAVRLPMSARLVALLVRAPALWSDLLAWYRREPAPAPQGAELQLLLTRGEREIVVEVRERPRRRVYRRRRGKAA